MKVLFYESRPEWGGAQKCELELLEGLKQFGIETNFVTSTHGPMLERIGHKGLEVNIVPIDKRIDGIRNEGIKGGIGLKCRLSFSTIPHFLKMARYILLSKPEVIYTSQFRSQLFIGWLAKLFGKKVVWHIHGEEKLNNLLGKLALATADKVIVVSRQLCEMYQANFTAHREKFIFVANGLDVNGKKPMDTKQETVHLMMVGALIEGKRQDLVISACKELVEKGLAIHLHIIGEKPHWHSDQYKNMLLTMVANSQLQANVTFHGWVENPTDLLANGDLFILPSDTEGQPLSIIEAMGVGLPCVATNVGGISELVEDGKTGLLIGKDSLAELVEKTEYLVKNRELRLKMGEAARTAYESKFTKRAFLEGVSGVLRTITK
ncbi:glycosyltransferase family 4 protein [Pseudoneobacillus sp. C159]